MKKLPYYLVILCIAFFVSCSNESFEEVVPDTTGTDGDNPDPDTDPDPDPDPEDPGNTATDPCDFDLSDVTSGKTYVINCVLDLNNQTINLPDNVTFEFDKGDIINGTLNFSSGGKIDGRLMSSKLDLEGDVTLIDPTFQFFPIRWEIVEGRVAQPIAFQNHKNIQKVVDLVKSLGAETFSINKMDAFFDTEDVFTNTVRLPSNFHFKMSENTHMRVQPSNQNYATKLFMIQNAENVTLSGGFLHGERDTHTGPPTGSGTLVNITSGTNILVENVHISDSGVSGLTINSFKFATDPEYSPSRMIRIRGCTFDSNRRNNMSVTDGTDIIIENCKIYRAGIDTEFSIGSRPKIGIDVEPTELQRIDGVIIRNCEEKEGAGAALLAAGGNNVTFENNTTQSTIGWNIASNVKILNNTIDGSGIGAGLKDPVGRRTSKGNIISGNTVSNAITGIAATNGDTQIFNNTFINCKVAMIINALTNADIYENTIRSDKESSFGFTIQDYADDVVFRANKVNVTGRAIFSDFPNFDDDELDFKISFIDNTFETTKFALINGTVGMTLTGNSFNNGVRIDGSRDILFDNNNVVSGPPFSIELSNSEVSRNVTISNNTIENTDTGGTGNGIKTSSSSDVRNATGIVIDNNTIKVRGTNNCIRTTKFDNMTITNNKSGSEAQPTIFFRGDNSVIRDNVATAGPTDTVDVEGSNNTVSNNTTANN
ncbi:right-handed parallel beta-helix repeat-containing protein [Aquimarina aggregata]|uniref:right-handed parallel beta-helix repeat-containing protein n=1 Tax=Aquimarina aggregata TaxID=1642818 RepID=UPI00249172B1|nr:right-handed parallel beta-helix repeat-containing protein [Aquimarina aggregata]